MARLVLKSLINQNHFYPKVYNKIVNPTVYEIKNRLYHKLEADHEIEVEVDSQCNIYRRTDSDYAIGKKNAVKKLEDLFNIKPFVANEIVMKCKQFRLTGGKTISDNYELCKSEGITDETMLKYPEILTLKNIDETMKLLKSMPVDINSTAVLLSLDVNTLNKVICRQIADSESFKGGRITFLSKLFKVPEDLVCDAMIKRPFLQYIDLRKIEEAHKILRTYGITTEAINKDYWVLMYSAHTIQTRLEFAKKNNVEKMKTWMVRCSSQIFERYLKRRSDNKEVLGNNSIGEYLAERLECTTEEAKYIMIKHPPLKNKSMTKMKEVIDFLYAEGFKPGHIVRTPKILFHSVETMKKRLEELAKQKTSVDSLYMLTKSQKQFQLFLNSLVKSSKKAKNKT